MCFRLQDEGWWSGNHLLEQLHCVNAAGLKSMLDDNQWSDHRLLPAQPHSLAASVAAMHCMGASAKAVVY